MGASYAYIRREAVEGTLLMNVFGTTTDQDGSFTPGVPSCRLACPGARRLRTGARCASRPALVFSGQARARSASGFVAPAPDRSPRLVAVPAARVAGRVVTKILGLSVADRTILHPGEPCDLEQSLSKDVRASEFVDDQDGRFTIDRLSEGTINIFVHGDGENETWTYRAANDVALKPAATADVEIELIRGVEVEGKVFTQQTGKPVDGARVGVYGLFRPRSGGATLGATTDADGRYRYRLPTGETYFYVMFARRFRKAHGQRRRTRP